MTVFPNRIIYLTQIEIQHYTADLSTYITNNILFYRNKCGFNSMEVLPYLYMYMESVYSDFTRAIWISENKWDEYDLRTMFPFGCNKICHGFYKCDCRRGLSVNATRVFQPPKAALLQCIKGGKSSARILFTRENGG